MTSQQQPTTPTISTAAALLLAVSVVAGTALAGIIAAQAVADIRVYVGTAGFLAAIVAVTGVGFIVQLAADRNLRHLVELEAKLDEQRDQGNAAAAAERINLRLLQGQG